MAARSPQSSTRKKHRYQWLIDALSEQPGFIQKPMFGAVGCYLDGRLVLLLCGRGEEPWLGVLVPTSREHHRSLRRDWPTLRPHPVLGKWLYLKETSERFEEIANDLLDRILARDSRLGVESS